jgi:hypothetical protein
MWFLFSCNYINIPAEHLTLFYEVTMVPFSLFPLQQFLSCRQVFLFSRDFSLLPYGYLFGNRGGLYSSFF